MADVMCLWDFVYAQQKVSYVHSKTQRTPGCRHMKPLSSFSVSSGSSGTLVFLCLLRDFVGTLLVLALRRPQDWLAFLKMNF